MTVTYKVGEKDTRPWGTWEVIDAGENYIVKRIVVFPHKKLSLQLHHHRSEHWIIAEGTGTITLGDKIFDAPQNTPLFIEVEQVHRMENKTDANVIFIEVQTGAFAIGSELLRRGAYGEPVVIFMDKHPRTVTAFCGTIYAGCFYVCLDEKMPEARMRAILDNLSPRFLICDEKNMKRATRNS